MDNGVKRKRPWSRLVLVVALLSAVVALAIAAIAVYRELKPADRVVVTITNIDPSTLSFCLVADTSSGPEVMWWSLTHLMPFSMHPGRHHPIVDGPETTKKVSWRDGERYGVLTTDADGHWWVFWFRPEEVQLQGRNWLTGGGEATFELPPKAQAEQASEELVYRAKYK